MPIFKEQPPFSLIPSACQQMGILSITPIKALKTACTKTNCFYISKQSCSGITCITDYCHDCTQIASYAQRTFTYDIKCMDKSPVQVFSSISWRGLTTIECPPLAPCIYLQQEQPEHVQEVPQLHLSPHWQLFRTRTCVVPAIA
eukprot:TRINITY_DN7144_c0_g1_i1.p1 TRINITY_DN7144_c0_g1~~TRINITY_DN7144_c0_g1_i1.p1  ORF type:complete len:144 (-),score=11.34 TRINITY_DN7144_c0_g1_i1:257-688(-)